MPKFAANLTTMYNEFEFLERFAAAAQDGFTGVEFLFPYLFSAADLRARLSDNGLTQVLFNAPPGDWNAGERGLAALPGRREEFRRGIAQALEYAVRLDSKRLHVMAGLQSVDYDVKQQRATYINNLAYAADQAAGAGVTVLIEPINTRDMPGYFLNTQADALEICNEIGASNLEVQFDIYHCQIAEGDVSTRLKRSIEKIGHVQIAGVPGRNEPDLGELNYPYLFQLLDDLGYAGWIGCEYRPLDGTSAGLKWLRSLQAIRH
jgi:hydroxypyruvate isomerase